MQAARRVYVYLVTFISLMVWLGGANALVRLVFGLGLGADGGFLLDERSLRQEFSRNGALLVVGAVVWAIHWLLAQRSVAPASANANHERNSALRKLLIYGVLFVAAWQIYFALLELLTELLWWLLGTAGPAGPGVFSRAAAAVLVYGLAWLYHWRVRAVDARRTPEAGGAATVRRWYFYLALFATLSILVFNLSSLARYLWRLATTSETAVVDALPGPLPMQIGWIVLSAIFWLWHWRFVQLLVVASDDEQRSALRKVYIYAVILQTVSVTLTSIALFLYNLLRLLIGTDPVAGSGESLLTAAGNPLITALIYAVFWVYHWRVLTSDAALVAEEPPLSAAIRRLYHYLVALIGLAVFSIGLANLLRHLADLALGGSATTNLSRAQWGDTISLFATLIAVGLPVWLVNWRRVQRRALAPGGADDRQSLVRRIYIYLILFAAVLALLASVVWLIYQLFLLLGGEPFDAAFTGDLSWALGIAITAGVILAYHLQVMAGDQRVAAALPARATAPPAAPTTSVILLRTGDADAAEAVLARLRRDMPEGTGLTLFPARDLTPGEVHTWLAGRVRPRAPEDAVAEASQDEEGDSTVTPEPAPPSFGS